MYRNFCQAVLPLLFQVFYNFTIFFCVYARKRTFCVFIHKKRGKIVLLRKFLHKKTTARKEKIHRRNGKKLHLFLPPDGMRACLFPIFPRADDALSAEKRTMRTGFFFYISALLFFPLSLRRRGRAPPLCLFPFRPLFLSFLLSRLRHFRLGAHVGGATLSCPLGAKKFPLSTNKTPFSKILLFHAFKLFLSEKIRTDSMTGGKGDVLSPFPPVTFFPPNARQRFHPHGTGALFHKIRNAHATRTCIRADGRPDRHHARRADAVLLLNRLAQQFRARRIGRIADVIGL